jgi:hypothetical protein
MPFPFPYLALHFLFLRKWTKSFPFIFNPNVLAKCVCLVPQLLTKSLKAPINFKTTHNSCSRLKQYVLAIVAD